MSKETWEKYLFQKYVAGVTEFFYTGKEEEHFNKISDSAEAVVELLEKRKLTHIQAVDALEYAQALLGYKRL